MTVFRWILTISAVLLALLFWYIALTVPMIAATPALILALLFSVLVFFASPKRYHHTSV